MDSRFAKRGCLFSEQFMADGRNPSLSAEKEKIDQLVKNYQRLAVLEQVWLAEARDNLKKEGHARN